MKIQSLSIVVPSNGCINKCPFCVSRMVGSNGYENLMDINHPHYDINVREYLKRMRFVADNGCQTLMLTGTAEPQQNKQFLATFALLHQQIGSPFTNIEMQTTGMTLDKNRDYLRFLRNFIGVNTIALSINAHDDISNSKMLGHEVVDFINPPLRVTILSDLLKEYDFNIRCCYNLSDAFDGLDFYRICEGGIRLGANQITFRRLYSTQDETPQAKWIREHQPSEELMQNIKLRLASLPVCGKTLYGSPCYDYNGVSIVFDDDCMGKNPDSDVKKYLILRPNCKLYSQWDSKASLVF